MIVPARGSGTYVPFGWPWVAAISAAASILYALAGGQDLNFDFVTYHYYLGHTAFSDRTSLDFLAASFQGYQSPLPYAPLAWLDAQGVPPWIHTILHASVHSLNLVALLFVSRMLLGGAPDRDERVALVALWLLGAIAPVYWILVGTTFADLSTSLLVLGGLWCCAVSVELRSAPRRAGWMLVGGACLAGLATGMRWHNAIYIVALASAVIATTVERPGERVRRLGILVAAATAGAFAGLMPWAWHNFREFGNPLFPFFNGWFRSPDYFPVNLPLTGFAPDTLSGWMTLPFRIASFSHSVYVETMSPDVRPALLVLAALAAAAMLAWRRIFAPAQRMPPARPARRFVLVFFAVGVALWLATSCNGRYGVVLFLLAGPVCGALALRVLRVRHVALVAAAVVTWQVALLQSSHAVPRWTSMPWRAALFDWRVPDWMSREPAVFLTFGYQTASTLVPALDPRSRHVNLVGQLSIPPDGPGSARVRRILDSSDGRLIGLFDFQFTQQSDPATRSVKHYFGEYLPMWGLDFTTTPCTLIALKTPGPEWNWLNRWLAAPYGGPPPEYIACELRRADPRAHESALARLREFRARLASFAASCPRYFGVPLSIVRHPGHWLITSLATFEFRIEVHDHGAVALQQLRWPYAGVVLGTQADPNNLPGGSDCAHWPARLAEAGRSSTR